MNIDKRLPDISFSSHLPAIVLDHTGRIISLSDSFCSFIDISNDVNNIGDLADTAPSNLYNLMKQYLEIISNEKSPTLHNCRMSINKERQSVTLDIIPLYLQENERHFLVLVFYNIDSSNRTGVDPQTSNEHLRDVLENISHIAVTLLSDPDMSKILYVNKGYEQIWGRSSQSLYQCPQSFFDLIHPEDKARVISKLLEKNRDTWDIEYRILREDGEIRYIHDSGKGIYTDQNQLLYYVRTAIDITTQEKHRCEIEKYAKKLEKFSLYDDLTGVINRRGIFNILDQALSKHQRYGHDSALIFIDVNKLKSINDNYGHRIGDTILIEISNHIKSRLRSSDSIGRYGGDEFIILLNETGVEDANKLMEEFYGTTINIDICGKLLPVSYDYGVALASDSGVNSVGDWIKIADSRMYIMKNNIELAAL